MLYYLVPTYDKRNQYHFRSNSKIQNKNSSLQKIKLSNRLGMTSYSRLKNAFFPSFVQCEIVSPIQAYILFINLCLSLFYLSTIMIVFRWMLIFVKLIEWIHEHACSLGGGLLGCLQFTSPLGQKVYVTGIPTPESKSKLIITPESKSKPRMFMSSVIFFLLLNFHK